MTSLKPKELSHSLILQENLDPVVGLSYVAEVLAESDLEMEPQYECKLCGNFGSSNGLSWSHVMGKEHRQRFLEKKSGRQRSWKHALSGELLREVRKYAENNLQLSKLIQTTKSDAKYPWPPGKAPWAKERGGSGINPYSQERVAIADVNREMRSQRKNSPSIPARPPLQLPCPDNVAPPSTATEANQMMELGLKMLERVITSKKSGVTENEAAVFSEALNSILRSGRAGQCGGGGA